MPVLPALVKAVRNVKLPITEYYKEWTVPEESLNLCSFIFQMWNELKISQAGVKNKNISVGDKKVCRTMLCFNIS